LSYGITHEKNKNMAEYALIQKGVIIAEFETQQEAMDIRKFMSQSHPEKCYQVVGYEDVQ